MANSRRDTLNDAANDVLTVLHSRFQIYGGEQASVSDTLAALTTAMAKVALSVTDDPAHLDDFVERVELSLRGIFESQREHRDTEQN